MALLSLFESGPKLALSIVIPVFLAILAVGYVLCYITYHLFLNPLRKFPGPKLWAISNIPNVHMALTGDGHRKILHLHLKYGPIVRIGPNMLSMNHPDASRDLRGHRKNGEDENPKAPFFAVGNEDNILGSNRLEHRRFRRALSHGFSAQTLREQEPIIMQYIDALIQGLHGECHGGTKRINIIKWINFTSFDVIGDLAFGEPFGCLQEETYHPWVALLFQSAKGLTYLVHMGLLPWPMPMLFYMLSRGIMSKWGEHREMSRDKVRKRQALGKSRPDFVDAMIRKTKSTGDEISFEELASNASVLVIAGSETTATLLSAATYFLATNRDCLAKLAHEVRSRFSNEGEIDMISVQNLSYMLAVLDESFRLFPPVPRHSPRIIGPGGDTILGHYIPEGTTVDTWHWSIYNHPDHFKQPDEFIPERWMNDPRFESDARRALQPFSLGPRDCIGKNLAYAEMSLILARLVWNFDIRLDSDTVGWHNKCRSFILWEMGPVNVYLTPRITKSA